MPRILVGTAGGLIEIDAGGARGRVDHAGRHVSVIAPEGWELWASLDENEVWHTAGVDWWFHVGNVDGRRATCIADTRAGVLVGTSEASLYRVAGEGLEPLPSFEAAPGRSDWYTPWGGPPDVRTITEGSDAVYVNVHVGGILRSRDRGETWEPTIDIDSDVHKVLARPGRVYAACALGLAVSGDDGDTWAMHSDGLHARYCRGVAVCGDALLLSASTGPGGRRSALYRSGLDGTAFERCAVGLPEWFDENIDSLCLDAVPGGAIAAFAVAGRVFASTDGGGTWDEVASGLGEVSSLLTL